MTLLAIAPHVRAEIQDFRTPKLWISKHIRRKRDPHGSNDTVKHGSLNVPIFHITQPWSVYGLLDGYFFRWCPIFPKWDIYQPLLMGALPSDKGLHNYGTSPFWIGKSTINTHLVGVWKMIFHMFPLIHRISFDSLDPEFPPFWIRRIHGFSQRLWRRPRRPPRCRSCRWAAAPWKGPGGWRPWQQFVEISWRFPCRLRLDFIWFDGDLMGLLTWSTWICRLRLDLMDPNTVSEKVLNPPFFLVNYTPNTS